MKRLSVLALLAIGCASTPAPVARFFQPGHADVYIVGDVEHQSADVMKMAPIARRAGRPLAIQINSLGGEAEEGIRLYHAIRAAGPTVCVVTETAASAAFLALQACTRRVMANTAMLATHQPVAIYGGPEVAFTPESAKEMYLDLKMTADAYNKLISERIDMPIAAYLQRVGNGAVWVMDSDAAIEFNAIDVVIDGSANPL